MADGAIQRALISVSDKAGLLELAKGLSAHGVEILSTGGTAKALKDAGLAVKDVAEHTGFPEMMDGRLKTLHPKVHGGLLAMRGNAEHQAAAAAHGIAPIDLLVVNLYPFEATVAKGAAFEDCIENIDIGGPAMIRAAAKNHAAVTVVVDPEDYGRVLDAMSRNGGATTLELRKALAAKAYARTAAYDAAIGAWFSETLGETAPAWRAFGGAARWRGFAVAQLLGEPAAKGPPGRRRLAQRLGEPRADRRVVGGRARVGLGGQRLAQLQRGGAAVPAHGIQDAAASLGVDDDGDGGVVLAAARIIAGPPMSMFSTHLEGGALRDRSLEGVEIDHQQVDRRDAVGCGRRLVLSVAAHGEQAAVHLGTQRLSRPSIISGKPVCSATSLTASPTLQSFGGAAGSEGALRPCALNPLASSRSSALSDTEISARWIAPSAIEPSLRSRPPPPCRASPLAWKPLTRHPGHGSPWAMRAAGEQYRAGTS